MDEKLTLATPQVEDANVNTETEPTTIGSEDEALATTPQVEESQEQEQNQEVDEYDKVWDDNDNSEFNLDEPVEEDEPTEESEPEQLEQKQTYTLKHKGKEIEVDSIDELVALAQKGLDYEFKMTRIKPFRQAIDIIEKTGIEPSDVKALADIKEGNKDALEYLGSKYGIDTGSKDEDIDNIFNDNKESEKQQYQPEIQNSTDPVKDYWEEYSKNRPDVAGKIVSYWDELDPTFQQELWKQEVFPSFVQSVESGEFDKVYPRAIKAKALNPAISWLQAYVSSAQDIIQPKEQKEPTGSVQRKETKKRSVVKNNYEDYDAVWNEDSSIEELEKQLFKGM